ncbi:extracellular solute-binding protein [Chelativorans sp.]|uniref:extracellular solute-binding protein n=1 Tax=Chelativorans sp. TaxID=2203393 RepID=UPI002810B440|nr:extracellular solute-binding protein [Chelativorans sp.]
MARTFWAAMALTASVAAAAAQEDVITVVHVEQNPAVQEFWEDLAKKFESANQGVDVQFQYLEAEAFKQKMTTLLQSSDRPDIIYSWAGGVLRAQVEAGVIADLTEKLDPAAKDMLLPAALDAFTLDGRIYGVPVRMTQVGIFYNKDMLGAANVDPASLATWDGFLKAIETLKAAGTTPLVVGGADKWPLMFYWSGLALRAGGSAAFEAAVAQEGEGFAAAPFVRAGELFQQLTALEPFQSGYMGTKYGASVGQFGDGKGAMMLVADFVLNGMKANAADGVGIPLDRLGFAPLPTVEGGADEPNATLGGINGWLVTEGASPRAADFLAFFMQPENQRMAAQKSFYIPTVKGLEAELANPIHQVISANLAKSTYHQNFYDQALGAAVGAVVNDVSAELAAGNMTPEEAADAVQEAYAFEQ